MRQPQGEILTCLPSRHPKWYVKPLLRRNTAPCLMRRLGIQGAVRGRPRRTTTAGEVGARPLDLVKRHFSVTAAGRLWVADLTYCLTWSGFVYAALSSTASTPGGSLGGSWPAVRAFDVQAPSGDGRNLAVRKPGAAGRAGSSPCLVSRIELASR